MQYIYAPKYVNAGLMLLTAIKLGGNKGLRDGRWGYPLLALFTLLESVSVGTYASFFKGSTVTLAAAMTGVTVAGMTAYAMRPGKENDMTARGQMLHGSLWGLFAMGIAGFFVRDKWLQLAYSWAGCILFSGFLVFDTQRVMGGKQRQNVLSPDDPIAGAMELYLDVVILFQHILRLLGSGDDR